MKKVSLLLATALLVSLLLVGCGQSGGNSAPADNSAPVDSNAATDNSVETDQEAADRVAALIDAIYVQQRTDETDAQCLAAKEGWDALTDAQKENTWIQRINYDPETEEKYNKSELERLGAYKNFEWLRKPMIWAEEAGVRSSLTGK